MKIIAAASFEPNVDSDRPSSEKVSHRIGRDGESRCQRKGGCDDRPPPAASRIMSLLHGRSFLTQVSYLNRHSPDGRRFKPNLRLFGVLRKPGPPSPRSRIVLGRAEVNPNDEIAECSVIKTRVSLGFSWNA
jgi:hypothetical protein